VSPSFIKGADKQEVRRYRPIDQRGQISSQGESHKGRLGHAKSMLR
jgi:hypothetical protein